MRNDLPEIKQALKDQIERVCTELLPNGQREGTKWRACSPHDANQKHLPDLVVALKGEVGAWKSWRENVSGDVIKLIIYCHNTDFKGALQWARDFLGLRAMSHAERQAMRQVAEAKAKRDERDNERARLYKLKKAVELFEVQAIGMGSGSAAERHARAYFNARQCGLEHVAYVNRESFRFANHSEWWKGAKWTSANGYREKLMEGPHFPAIHCAMRQATGAITCCHVTFLDPVHPTKAPVTPAKLMFGEASGAVIEVSTGPTGLPFWRADQSVQAPLIIAEGVETALSLAIAVPQARVWAGGSLAGMGTAPVHLACVSDVTVARDNNIKNAAAHSALAKAIAQLEAHGKPLVVMRSHVGDDFNDLIKGEAA